MTLTSRTSAQPVEYVASNAVEFTGEFNSLSNDEYNAYIADASYAGTGNQNTGGSGGGLASNPYRYGFNGKENDGDVKGDGNQIDYDKRIYDPRVGRFYSIDPLQTKFPFYSPYQFAGNTPIQAIDLDGAEEFHYTMTMDKQGRAVLNLAEPVRYNNHHSLFWGLFEFNTKIDVKRYQVDYGGKSYHIGFAQYGTGYANAWKAENFENDYVKQQGDAIAFEYNYVDDNHSQAGSDAATVVNSQLIGAETAIPFEHVSTPGKATNKAAMAANGGNPRAAIANTAEEIAVPGRVQSRINVANDATRFTPVRPSTGQPVSAGFNHVTEGHFDRPVGNNRSVFSISRTELKGILQSEAVVSSTATGITGGQYVRTVDVGRTIGTTSLKQGGTATSRLQIITDRAGNLITTYPVK